MPNKLSESDCRSAIVAGDFNEELRTSAPAVAIVLTQSWCPQWRFMQSYLTDVEKQSGDHAAIYYVEYDRESFHRDFMTFKEDIFGNREIPYVRYYRNGKLHAESNYLSKQGFLSKLGIE
ncbi:MAG: hypothetical protein WCT14_04925 [Treponemataceae bacterium]